MKKLVIGILGVCALALSLSSIAQTRVIVKQTPVVITKQGNTYIVPAGTAATTTYFTYVDTDTRYVCTYEEPSELAGVQFTTLALTLGDTPRNVRCYPETYFTVSP